VAQPDQSVAGYRCAGDENACRESFVSKRAEAEHESLTEGPSGLESVSAKVKERIDDIDSDVNALNREIKAAQKVVNKPGTSSTQRGELNRLIGMHTASIQQLNGQKTQLVQYKMGVNAARGVVA
jgi:predicted  nucleic acid-binding Zn-ribbon protein